MTAQTTSTDINLDDTSLLGLADGDQITINAGRVTVNSDVRWGQNAAVLGNVAISNTLGGTFYLDATQTWEIPFSVSLGNVPTLAALNSNAVTGVTSGATGELLRVWNTTLTPLASGVAMPAVGWIKLRTKTGTFSAGEVINLPGGATIVAGTAGKASWIHVVGATNTNITIPRLGSWESRGAWYALGTTSGALGQTLQFPVSDMCPALQIETSPGSGVFEWYLNAGSRWANATQYVSSDARGKYFGCSATGLISMAVANCGYLPPAGCAIRMPNIILGTSTSANWTLPLIGTTLGARWKPVTTGAGVIDLEQTTGAAFLSTTSAYSLRLVNCATFDQVSVVSTGNQTVIDSMAIGLSGSIDATALQVTNCFGGGSISSTRAVAYVSSTFGRAAVSFLDAVGFTLIDLQSEIFGSATTVTRGTGVNSLSLQRCVSFNVVRPVCLGARFAAAQVDKMTASGMLYADCLMGTSQNVQPMYALDWAASVTNSSLDGFAAFAGLANVCPYTGIVNYATGRNLEFRNIGSVAAYYDAGNLAGYLGSGASSDTVTFRRCYINNLRTSLVQTFSSTTSQSFINAHGDYADGQVFGANAMTAKGVRWTPTLSGQLAVYGTHWLDGFQSATVGFVTVAVNEPMSTTTAQCAITAGTPKFTSNGSAVLKTVGDQITWTMPYAALGHTGLTNYSATGSNTGNLLYEFQVKTTGDYSAWATLSAGNLAAVGAIDPATGFWLNIRATTVTANVNNILSFIQVATATDAVSQMTEYPLPVESYMLTLTGLKPDTEVRIYRASDLVEISGIESVSGDFAYTYAYSGTLPVVIVIFALGWQVIRLDYSLGRASVSLPIQQTVDRNFSNL